MILPISGLLLISFFSRARAEMWTKPKAWAIAFDCVLRPEPGGPTRIILGGLLGAFSLKRRLSILIRSGITSLYDLSVTSYSKMNWLKASRTPFMLSSYSCRHCAARSSKSGP